MHGNILNIRVVIFEVNSKSPMIWNDDETVFG
jgi:hypothetical protein